jgi:hypothetical protein
MHVVLACILDFADVLMFKNIHIGMAVVTVGDRVPLWSALVGVRPSKHRLMSCRDTEGSHVLKGESS